MARRWGKKRGSDGALLYVIYDKDGVPYCAPVQEVDRRISHLGIVLTQHLKHLVDR